jgi:superfamily II DNA/RNA helicase
VTYPGFRSFVFEWVSLCGAYASVPDQLTLVFVQKKRTASWVAGQLTKTYGINAESIHGDRSQSQREAALASFKSGKSPVMVATDVAARGGAVQAQSS